MMLDFVFVCEWEQKWNDFVEGTRSFDTDARFCVCLRLAAEVDMNVQK